MSFINLLENDVWTEADLDNRRRALVASMVSDGRQQELQTILLWHISGVRTASREEWAQVEQMKDAWVAAAAEYDAARSDLALLREARLVESGETSPTDQSEQVKDLVAARASARKSWQ